MEYSFLDKVERAIKLGFKYNAVTGVVTTPIGKEANKISKNGYILLTLREKSKKTLYLYTHQFAWYCVYKEKVECIDHINRIRTDNRIENLKSVTNSENARNRFIEKGYSYCKRSKKFIARIMVDYKCKQLGSFNDEESARKCYLENKQKYHNIKL